ncbi:WD40-repeat-containing domain protein [Sphaerosporella brunnea]|uniref:WD40-repeat-containing domain protein n=1 Tax=Sphaerosporella brunnea TaxID=1250544 RepID=A0A5J5F2C6_9PEZI|nr:WD40-repeat-containing domain protein [Sphaerosporella brunnea]
MPAPDSPQVLIGRYLQSNGFTKTLAAFLEETNLRPENLVVEDPSTALTIEKVLDEKRLYDLSLKVEKVEVADKDPDFSEPYPSISTEITPLDVTPSNVLFVSVVPELQPFEGPVLIATAADRSLRLFSAQSPHTMLRNFTTPTDSAILSVSVVEKQFLLIATMTGRLLLLSASTGEALASIRPHEKYAIRVLYSAPYVISAAYDKTICVHALETSAPSFSESPVGKITLPTPPEALAVVMLPSKQEKAIVFSRRESTSLYYHLLQPGLPEHSTRNLSTSNWVSYHPMSVAVHPSNPSLLAVATSSVPHMKLILVRVDSEEVTKELFTGAPQSAYSTAVLAWRPDGSGVWLNADEGIVRGLEVKTGKVKAKLVVSGNGEKVRTLWAGDVKGLGECLVTGSFDKGLKVWKVLA